MKIRRIVIISKTKQMYKISRQRTDNLEKRTKRKERREERKRTKRE